MNYSLTFFYVCHRVTGSEQQLFEQRSQDGSMHAARPGRPVRLRGQLRSAAQCQSPLARRRRGVAGHAGEDVQDA